MDCNPIEGAARIAKGEVDCSICQGTGKTKHARPRACSTCEGSGREYVPIELRASMIKSLQPYYAPKLKSIEHLGAGGGPIQHRHSGVLKVPGMLSPGEWESTAKAEQNKDADKQGK